MKKVFPILLFLLIAHSAVAQPSFLMSLKFRFYENNKEITLETFLKNYQLLNERNKNVTQERLGIRLEPGTKNLWLDGDVVYNDFIRKFVFGKDTMTLYLKNHLERGAKFNYQIEKLSFRKGHYMITDNHLSEIDFNKANLLYREAKLNEKIFGNAKGYELFYKSFGTNEDKPNHIAIYANKNNTKKLLANVSDEGFIADNVSLLKIKKSFFIYIHFNHTSGNADGKLYYLSTKTLKMTEVSMKKNNHNIPKDLSPWKGYGLSWDGKHFTTGLSLRAEEGGKEAQLITYYKLVKINDGQYVLKPIKNDTFETTD